MATTIKTTPGSAGGRAAGKAAKSKSNGNGKGPGMLGRGPDNGQLAAALHTQLEQIMLGVKIVDPSPFQPRSSFPEEELRGLAESIAQQGQLSPILVRASARGGRATRYELVDGHRRFKAIELIGWDAVRAEVGQFTDAQVRQIVLVSALQRADLTAIEEARAFKAAIDAGDAPGPTELARQLGLSQGHVSNRLRLLELPADVQAKIISQEIPVTHGRVLATLKDYPKLCSAIARDLAERVESEGAPPVEEFGRSLWWRVGDHAQELTGNTYDTKTCRNVPHFTPTAEQREQLGVVAIEGTRGGRKKPETVEFATNKKLWNKLQQTHRTKWLQENPANAKKRSAPPSAKKKKLTPAQEKTRAADQAKQFARRLWEWYAMTWTKRLIALQLGDSTPAAMERVTLWLLATQPTSRRDDQLVAAIKAAGGKVKSPWPATMAALAALGELDLAGVINATVAACFWDGEKGPVTGVGDEDLVVIAQVVEVDHEAAWLSDQAGDLSEAFWNLHTKQQLVDLAAELKLPGVKPVMTKREIVKLFLAVRPGPDDTDVGLPYPKELKKIKRAK